MAKARKTKGAASPEAVAPDATAPAPDQGFVPDSAGEVIPEGADSAAVDQGEVAPESGQPESAPDVVTDPAPSPETVPDYPYTVRITNRTVRMFPLRSVGTFLHHATARMNSRDVVIADAAQEVALKVEVEATASRFHFEPADVDIVRL